MQNKKNQKNRKNILRNIVICIEIIWICARLGFLVIPNIGKFTSSGYTESYYKEIEDLFNRSQYRLKDNPAIIPDEVVFSYASGAYVRGMDPIYVNSEHTPLGKYMIGLGIILMRNDQIVILLSFLLMLIVLYKLGKLILGSTVLALIPVLLCLYEKVIIDQLRVTPLLDIIQLPFIFLALYFFLKEKDRGRFFWTSISLGFVMATKTIVPAMLLYGIFVIFLLLYGQFKKILLLVCWSFLSCLIFTASYVKTFMDGYTFPQFLKFQKWIFMYQKSKLEYPFSFWRFIYLNEWQAWWGDRGILKGEDWMITWPVFVSLPFIRIIISVFQRIMTPPEITLMLLYICIYEAFLSIGVVSSRFFLPLFPICYIVGIDTVRRLFHLWKK